MRKYYILICVLFIVLKLNSQTINFPQPKIDISKVDLSKLDLSFLNFNQFSFGLKISPSIAWMNVKHYDLQSDGATMKIAIGGVADYALNPYISIISGINYNTFGGYVSDDNSLNDINSKGNYKINYSQIEIPLSARLKTIQSKKTSYYLQIGLATGFVLSGNEKHYKYLDNKLLTEKDIYSSTNLTNYNLLSVLTSIGTEYNISKSFKLFGEISYKSALTNLANNNYVKSNLYNTTPNLLPGSLDFSIGVMFK